MAEPITMRPQRPDIHGEAANPHAAAIESAIGLLQLLHDRGVLDLLHGLLSEGDRVVETVVEAVDTPEAVRGIRNFLLLTQFFGSIPPEVLHSLVQTATDGAKREKLRKAPGFFELYRRLRSEDSRHALAVMLDLVESVGKGL